MIHTHEWYCCQQCKDKKKLHAKTYRQKHAKKIAMKKRFEYLANKELFHQRRREWAIKNPDIQRAAKRRHHIRHRAQILARAKMYRSAHKDEMRITTRNWRVANRERSNQNHYRWVAKNPEKAAVISSNKRARRDHAIGDSVITAAQWAAVRLAYNNLCAYCGEQKPLTIDHVVPLSRGGPHLAENIVPACKSCNSRKNTKTGSEYLPGFIQKQLAFT